MDLYRKVEEDYYVLILVKFLVLLILKISCFFKILVIVSFIVMFIFNIVFFNVLKEIYIRFFLVVNKNFS